MLQQFAPDPSQQKPHTRHVLWAVVLVALWPQAAWATNPPMPGAAAPATLPQTATETELPHDPTPATSAVPERGEGLTRSDDPANQARHKQAGVDPSEPCPNGPRRLSRLGVPPRE